MNKEARSGKLHILDRAGGRRVDRRIARSGLQGVASVDDQIFKMYEIRVKTYPGSLVNFPSITSFTTAAVLHLSATSGWSTVRNLHASVTPGDGD
jgi:hypothetical protein